MSGETLVLVHMAFFAGCVFGVVSERWRLHGREEALKSKEDGWLATVDRLRFERDQARRMVAELKESHPGDTSEYSL